MVALVQDTKSQMLDQFDNQNQMQTSTALALVETIRAEATELIKVIQNTTVRTRAHSLSVYSQVEPDGFASQTTRVSCLLLTYHIIDLGCSDERQAARRGGHEGEDDAYFDDYPLRQC